MSGLRVKGPGLLSGSGSTEITATWPAEVDGRVDEVLAGEGRGLLGTGVGAGAVANPRPRRW